MGNTKEQDTKKAVQKIGVDLGFYQVKGTDLSQEILFESVIGYDFASMVDTFDGHGITFTDPAFVAGQNAIKYASTPIRQKDDGWIETPECRMLFQAGMSELIFDSSEIHAVVSLPISLYKSRKGKLKENLDGVYKFTRQGRPEQSLSVNVVELPQGFTVICNEVLDDAGEPTSKDISSRLGVIDIGGKTTNILLADALRDVEHQSDSVNIGCWTMIEKLKQLLAKRFDRPSVSDFAIETALRTEEFSHHGKKQNVSQEVQQVKGDVLRVIQTHIRRLWPDIGSIDKIFIAGGGAHYFGKQLCEIYSQAVTVQNPIFSNARGAAKFARRG